MIKNYLKGLIESNSRVIVPDFGAFMVQTSAKGKQISFNDFLKFNDGLLANEIIRAEKITKGEATEKIKVFVKEIQDTFAKKGKFVIEGVGVLSKDNFGNIKFETSVSEVSTSVSAPIEPTVDNSKAEEKENTGAKGSTIEESKNTETIIPPRANGGKSIPSKPSQPIPSEPKAAAGITNKKVSITKPTSNMSSNNSKKTVLIIIAAVAGIGLIVGGLFLFGVIGGESEPVKVATPEPAPVVDSLEIAKDTMAVDTIPAPIVVEEPQVDPNAKKYYVVAGCFEVPSNAENFCDKLKSEGYPAEIINRRTGFKTVSYKTFYSFEEALEEWKEMRVVNPQTWILVK